MFPISCFLESRWQLAKPGSETAVKPLMCVWCCRRRVIFCWGQSLMNSSQPTPTDFISGTRSTGHQKVCRPTVFPCFLPQGLARTRLPSIGLRSWSRFLAVSLQVMWVTNPAVGCHYFLPRMHLPSQPLRGLLPISLLGEQRHDGCEQFGAMP